jgi:agmatinase
MLPIEDAWIGKNNQARKYARQYIKFLEGEPIHLTAEDVDFMLQNINVLSANINDWVYRKAQKTFDDGKIPVVLGGDHSSPYGLIKSIADRNEEFGILQIDAHADLRPAYEGFKFSHASIMHNVLKFPQVAKLVQVGIRDFCEQEFEVMTNDPRIVPFYAQELAHGRFDGESWSEQVAEIVNELPDLIYVSLDADGLEQNYAPSTGTPVPGGLSYDQLNYLLHQVVISGKKIISFDICEISGKNSEWDAIVGSRLLYNMANLAAVSQKLLEFR